MAIAKELRYHPNAAAQALANRRTQSIGVLFGRVRAGVVSNPYAAGVLEGILATAAAQGFDGHIFTSHWVNAAESAPAFRDQRAAGVVVVQPFTDSGMVEGLTELGLPLVIVSWSNDLAPVSWVEVDNFVGSRLAIEHLVELGHRRIAHLSGDSNYASAQQRLAGYQQAMSDLGLEVRPDDVFPGTYRGLVDWQTLFESWKGPRHPTAVYCANDALAMGFIREASALGFRVPRDFSVIGFNDTVSSALGSPALTTLREPLVQMGQEAAAMLIERLEAPQAPPEQRLLRPDLVLRATTAAPRFKKQS